MNTVTHVIFLTSSLGFEIFSSAANPVFSLEDLPLCTLLLEFSKNPVDSLRSMRQSSSTSHLEGKKQFLLTILLLALVPLLQHRCYSWSWQGLLGSWIWNLDWLYEDFNKIILKGTKKKKLILCGLTIDLCSRTLRWCTRRLQSESSFVVIHTLVARSLLQSTSTQFGQLGRLASPLSQRPYVEPTCRPKSSRWGALEALIYLFC